MSKTIQCTNSNCQTVIPVPEGTSYVSCPSCGTFYFPSDFDAGPGPIYQPPTIDAPPAWQPPGNDQNFNQNFNQNYDQNFNQNQAPSFQSDEHIWQSETPKFIEPKREERRPENLPIGFLVKYDGTQLPLKVGSNHIGRKEGDLLINDKTVSRKHCVIEVSPKHQGGGWEIFISDIGKQSGTASTNGVFIENRSIRLENYERVQIYHGMTIQLGSVHLRLHIS